MKTIYNEGRVVGLSAYELYVRQLLLHNPEATPLTEKEWLASALSANASMILRVPEGTTAGYHTFYFPAESDLTACSIVYGSVFQGEVELSEDGTWATAVKDYGLLISNTASSHPVTPGASENVPTKPNTDALTEDMRKRAREFLKVQSGLVIQPGTWTPNEGDNPPFYSSLEPNFAGRAFVRLFITTKIEFDLYILLHGLVSSTTISGRTAYSDQGQSPAPADGDFLGPAAYPWSCPIVLLATTDVTDIIARRVSLLGEYHEAFFVTNLTDESENPLTTEDGELLLGSRHGSVAEMWREAEFYNM